MPPKVYAKKSLGPLTPTTLRDYLRFNGGKTVIQHFRGLDSDSDGELTLKELKVAVCTMGFLDATDEDCKFVFRWLDSDSSGVVPYKELDKKLRERPMETDGEREAREAAERAAAEKKAAEEAARLAALLVAQKATDDAAAKAAADAKKAKKKKPKSPKTPKSLTKPKEEAEFKRVPFTREPPKPKEVPEFKKFTGSERYVQPTLAANGYPLFYENPTPAVLENREAWRSVQQSKRSAPVSGDESFLKGTIGTASLADQLEFLAKAAAREELGLSAESVRPLTDRHGSSATGAEQQQPTTERRRSSFAMPSFSTSRRRVSQSEIASKALEAKRIAEADKRERVQEAARRTAEKAFYNPLPTKHPQVWMPKSMASFVTAEEAAAAAERSRQGDLSERGWQQMAMFEDTVTGLGFGRLVDGLGEIDEGDDMWA